jgi:hypothetical protein
LRAHGIGDGDHVLPFQQLLDETSTAVLKSSRSG